MNRGLQNFKSGDYIQEILYLKLGTSTREPNFAVLVTQGALRAHVPYETSVHHRTVHADTVAIPHNNFRALPGYPFDRLII